MVTGTRNRPFRLRFELLKFTTFLSHNEQDGKRPEVQGRAKDVVPFEKSIKTSVYVTGVNQ
jgi:hypothetical protein